MPRTHIPTQRRALAALVAIALLALSVGSAGLPNPAQAAGGISGMVFRDFDADGARDLAAPAEPGIGGVTVTAYGPDGAQRGQTTTSAVEATLGQYALTPSGAGPFRVEFTGWPAYLRPSAAGAGDATSVRFVPDAGAAGLDLALHNPAEYCQSNPLVATGCYTNGDPSDPAVAPGGLDAGERPWLLVTPYAPASTAILDNSYIATGAQVGATWGLAYQRSSKLLLASAVMKRHAGLGPNGPGAIYRIDPSGANTPSLLVNLNAASFPAGTSVGADPRAPGDLPNSAGTPNYDPSAFDAVGKFGIGGIALSEDEGTLWAVNLTTRSLIEIQIGVPATPPSPADITVHPLPDPGCASGVFRPWAVKAHAGQVYVGGVCSGELPYAGKNSDPASLRAYIFRHDPAGAAGSFTQVFDFALDYPRGSITFSGAASASAAWLPWIDEWDDIGPLPAGWPTPGNGPFSQTMYPQPMLTALEFDADGAIVLGMVDRASMQLGNQNFSTAVGSYAAYEGASAGDILRVCADASAPSGYSLESNGACPGALSGSGIGNGQGPGGGEFFGRDTYLSIHNEISLGGLALHVGRRTLLSTVFDADDTGPVRASGLRWFNSANGAVTDYYNVFAQDQLIGTDPPVASRPGSFGKAGGLSDVELLCDAAPIEIGNRVWRDINGDGVQGAAEPPIAGVTVRLYDSAGALVPGATAVTDAAGVYRFSSAPGTSAASLIYGLPIDPRGSYSVRLDNPADYVTGPLALLTPSAAGSAGPSGSMRDANGVASAPTDVRAAVALGGAGANDHTIDFGFYEPIDLRLVKSVAPVAPASGSPYLTGDTVEYTLTIDNLGTATALAGYTVSDPVPSGLSPIPGSVVAPGFSPCAFSGQDLSCAATSDLAGSGAAQVTISYRATITAASGALTNAAEVTRAPNDAPERPVTPSNNRDQETITIGALTYSLGNRVWIDTNDSGAIEIGEAGVDGASVSVYAANASGAPVGPALGSAVTAGGGYYRFDNLLAGQYVVVVNASNFAAGQVLAGHVSSSGRLAPASSADSRDSGFDAPLALGVISGPVTLGPGSSAPTFDGDAPSPSPGGEAPDARSDRTVDFGFFLPAAVGNTVWHDLNGDGQRQPGEPGAPGVTVTLYDAGGQAVATATTDADGGYSFGRVVGGTYTVGFSNLPSGTALTDADQGSDATDSDIDPTTGRSAPITLLPGQSDLTVWAGLVPVNPTAITLLHLSAERAGSAVRLRWITGGEVDSFGFQIYRSATPDRSQAARVTGAPILSRGRGAGAEYAWSDTSAGAGGYYWLEEIGVGGATAEYGPVSGSPTAAGGGERTVFLPVIGS